MKKTIPTLLILLLFLGGAAALLYPSVSNWIAETRQTHAIQSYHTSIESLAQDNIRMEWERASSYNAALSGRDIPDPFGAQSGLSTTQEGYASVLDIGGLMGHIEIPKTDCSLPIRHGTGEAALRRGVGHLESSSLPVGGEGNHAVLTSHRGLSSARLFTDLDCMEIGDLFHILVLDQTLSYQVDQILVVDPHDTEALRPVPGMDLVTLVTCTPYAINSHRLLVRGVRVPTPNDASAIESEPLKMPVSVTTASVAVAAAGTVGVYLIKWRGRKRR